MPNIIDSIQISSSTFDVRDKSATTVVNLTQEQYDNLPSSAKTANVLYNITDATAGDLSQYWTSAQTQSAITEATSGKADTSYVDQSVSGKVDITTFNTYSGSVETALSGKQDTLSAGTGIDITDNVISATGGGGKAIEAGRGISVTTGETADTVSFNLPISAGTGSDSLVFGRYGNVATGQYSAAFGNGSKAQNNYAFVIGNGNNANGSSSFAGGNGMTSAIAIGSFAFGYNAQTRGYYSVALGGNFLRTENSNEVALGNANISNTGSTDADKTIFSVGNGTSSSARHNAFEIRQNGDIYLSSGGTDIKLQDHLGGGGGGITSGEVQSMIDESISGKANSSDVYIKSETSGATEIATALSGKQDTLSAGTNITIVDNVISATGGGGGITSGEVQSMIDESISGKTDESAFTAHTADTTIHVTSAEKAIWNAKSDFSGDYNDLSNKLSAGTNITIVDNVISATGGGGKAIEAGRGISVTTGETADTISVSLPISAGTGTYSIKCGETDGASGSYSFAIGANGVKANGQCSFAGGSYSQAKGFSSMAFGRYNIANNYGEVALGFFNKSNGSSSAAGNSSGNTLFSVGNGTNSASNTRHNAFEIRQNGDIYLSSGGTDIKLQDHLGGGGSSYTAGDGIDITNDVISVTGMTAESAFTAHTADTTIHVTSSDKSSWNGAATNASNAVTALGGLSLVKLTQAEYDALATKDSNTLYVING